MGKRERDGGGGSGGDKEDGDLYGAESVVTGSEREGGEIYTLQGGKDMG